MQNTPVSERLHIGFFGRRNVGKSSLVNAVTGQALSVVSDVKGTTTDAVIKSMELLPLGPVLIMDTPGLDDEGALGALRMEKARQALLRSDIAVLATDAPASLGPEDTAILNEIHRLKIPCLVVHTKADLLEAVPQETTEEIWVSAQSGAGIHALKEKLGAVRPQAEEKPIAGDLVPQGSLVILVCPIDESAPKGRLILPQQLVQRELLDRYCAVLVLQPEELSAALKHLNTPPALVITDSQAFRQVAAAVPETVPLTSFSILMARYKGFLRTAVEGISALNRLNEGDTVLIAEGCTHHRQCNDIGTVKLPRWLTAHSGREIQIETRSGHDFPADLTPYAAVIHCGGCMITEREVQARMIEAREQGIPFTNYGIAIAYMNGILERSLRPLPAIHALLEELK